MLLGFGSVHVDKVTWVLFQQPSNFKLVMVGHVYDRHKNNQNPSPYPLIQR